METRAGARRALIVLLGVVFVNIAGFGVVIPLLPFYGRAFHATPFQISLMFSTFAVGPVLRRGVLGPAFGSDRPATGADHHHLRHRGGLCGPGLFANIAAACVWRLVGGLMSGNISTIQGYLADVTPHDKRPGAWACWAPRSAWAS